MAVLGALWLVLGTVAIIICIILFEVTEMEIHRDNFIVISIGIFPYSTWDWGQGC